MWPNYDSLGADTWDTLQADEKQKIYAFCFIHKLPDEKICKECPSTS